VPHSSRLFAMNGHTSDSSRAPWVRYHRRMRELDPIESNHNKTRRSGARAARAGDAGGSGCVERTRWMAQGVVDTIMVGKLGPAAIGAVALGNAVFYTPSLFGIDCCLALIPGVAKLWPQGL